VVYPAHKRLKPAARSFVDWLLGLPKIDSNP
jgi:LysR family transcriptional regulator, glycine cleavage system transcriptional activator